MNASITYIEYDRHVRKFDLDSNNRMWCICSIGLELYSNSDVIFDSAMRLYYVDTTNSKIWFGHKYLNLFDMLVVWIRFIRFIWNCMCDLHEAVGLYWMHTHSKTHEKHTKNTKFKDMISKKMRCDRFEILRNTECIGRKRIAFLPIKLSFVFNLWVPQRERIQQMHTMRPTAKPMRRKKEWKKTAVPNWKFVFMLFVVVYAGHMLFAIHTYTITHSPWSFNLLSWMCVWAMWIVHVCLDAKPERTKKNTVAINKQRVSNRHATIWALALSCDANYFGIEMEELSHFHTKKPKIKQNTFTTTHFIVLLVGSNYVLKRTIVFSRHQ